MQRKDRYLLHSYFFRKNFHSLHLIGVWWVVILYKFWLIYLGQVVNCANLKNWVWNLVPPSPIEKSMLIKLCIFQSTSHHNEINIHCFVTLFSVIFETRFLEEGSKTWQRLSPVKGEWREKGKIHLENF